MLTHSRTPLRADRLRALNVPQPVDVQVDADGRPVAVAERQRDRRVETILETWRIDDEWWRRAIVRRYVEVVLEGGAHVVLYQDLVTGGWFAQRP